MAGKTKNMSQIKQLLLLHKQGIKKKTISRRLGMSKNTVKGYLQKFDMLISDEKSGFTIDKLIKLDNPVLEAKFHAGNPTYKEEERYVFFKDRIPYFLKELTKKGVTRHLLWQEYRSRYLSF